MEYKKEMFCETKNFSVISKMANYFIAEHFPDYIQEFLDKEVKFTFLGKDDDEHLKNMILMCKYLTNWFYHKKVSPYKMKINVDF